MSTIICRGEKVTIEKGTKIIGDCVFGDRHWTVAKVEEKYDPSTKENEVVIHCDNGRIFQTKNKEQNFGFLNRELFISSSDGKNTWRW